MTRKTKNGATAKGVVKLKEQELEQVQGGIGKPIAALLLSGDANAAPGSGTPAPLTPMEEESERFDNKARHSALRSTILNTY